MATTASEFMTFAEWERLPEPLGHRCELRQGEPVEVAPPKHGHYLIQRRLRNLLQAAAGDAGEVDTELGFRALPEYEYRIADVAFVSRPRWHGIPENGNLAGTPELVVEVLSPSNTASEIFEKEQLCLENGSLEFWVVDPVRRQVKVSSGSPATGIRTVTFRTGREIPLLFGGALAVDSIFGSASV